MCDQLLQGHLAVEYSVLPYTIWPCHVTVATTHFRTAMDLCNQIRLAILINIDGGIPGKISIVDQAILTTMLVLESQDHPAKSRGIPGSGDINIRYDAGQSTLIVSPRKF